MLANSYSTILRIAVPLMAGTFIQSIVLITDASFLSRYDITFFDASGNAGLFYITLIMGLSGIGDGAQILMARKIGEKSIGSINKILQSSLFINIILASCFFVLMTFLAPYIIDKYVLNSEIANGEKLFLSMRSYGFFLAAIIISINSFFMAMGKTWVILLSTLTFALTNIIFDYLLIYGIGPFPELGIQGAALASVLGELMSVIVLVTLLLSGKSRKIYHLSHKLQIEIKTFFQVIRIGSPLMLQGFLALSSWALFFTWIEQLSQFELTVSQNIRSVYFLAFVPIFGFAATTKTYVSQYLGSKKENEIKYVIRKIQLLTICFLLISFHGAIFYPYQLISWINPSESYITESGNILQLVVGSIFIYGLISPFYQTISGSGNTRVTLIIEIFTLLIYLITAYLFIIHFKLSILKIWTVEYIYFGTLGLLSILYLRFFNWKKKLLEP